MSGTRADHYRWADELLWKARRGGLLSTEQMLAAALVHATLAAAGPGVEQEVQENERAAARALAGAEDSQRSRQAARPPLPVVAEETAGTVRPKPGPPRATCRCRADGLPHELGAVGCEFQ